MAAVRRHFDAFNRGGGDGGYGVVPATMTFKVRARQAAQTGAIFAVALRQLAEGWRIAAWATEGKQ